MVIKTLGKKFIFEVDMVDMESVLTTEIVHVHAEAYYKACEAVEQLGPVATRFIGEDS